MRFVRFLSDGIPETGLTSGNSVLALSRLGLPYSIDDICRGGQALLAEIDGLQRKAPETDWIAETALDHIVPIERPGKIICLGLNYHDHAIEGGHPIPDYPSLFMRAATSLLPHRAELRRPSLSISFDYEAELMVVIGQRAKNLSADDALSAVFGYTAFNDASLRDYQHKSTQWTAGKNFDGTGCIGPAIVTADELPPGAADLAITFRLNGQVLQHSNTSNMIFPVARTLALLSEIMTLEPGDLIAMGTPGGVGFARKPPLWLKPGDACEVEIEKIGILSNRIVADALNAA